MLDTTIVINLVELVCAFGMGVLTAAASFKILGWVTRDLGSLDEIRKNNVSLSILFASILVASALIAREAADAMSNTLGAVSVQGLSGDAWLEFAGFALLYAVLAVILAVVSVALSARLVMWLTKGVDEVAQIKDNNMSVAITLGAVIVMMGLFMAPAIQGLLTNLIPYGSGAGQDEWDALFEEAAAEKAAAKGPQAIVDVPVATEPASEQQVPLPSEEDGTATE